MSSPPRDDTQPRASFLIGAIGINLLLGVFYGWSLFLAPLEDVVQRSRADLSFVPALGLLCFTVGVLVHDAVIRRIRLAVLVSGVVAAAGLGHLTFWLFPSYPALLLGYGAVFGSAAGIGYGLALALARTTFSPTRGWTVGLTVAAFAAGGMAVSAMGAAFGPPQDMASLFGVIGAVFLPSALALGLLLRGSELTFGDGPRSRASPMAVQRGPFLRLAFGYFVLCYLGLLVVSHGVALLAASGEPAFLAPFVLNAGYIAGAFLGGVIAARRPGRAVPLAFLLASTVSALSLSLPLPPAAAAAAFVAVFVIGAGFGSTVSVFVMMLTRSYGSDRAGALFGRLNVSYGLAGFLAPSITGWMYELSGDYTTSLWLGGLLGILGLVAMAGNAKLGTRTPT